MSNVALPLLLSTHYPLPLCLSNKKTAILKVKSYVLSPKIYIIKYMCICIYVYTRFDIEIKCIKANQIQIVCCSLKNLKHQKINIKNNSKKNSFKNTLRSGNTITTTTEVEKCKLLQKAHPKAAPKYDNNNKNNSSIAGNMKK